MCVWVCEADQKNALCVAGIHQAAAKQLDSKYVEHSCMPVSDEEGWNKAVWIETRQSAMLLHSFTWLKGKPSATAQYAVSGGDRGGVPKPEAG